MRKIAVTGAFGQLGVELCAELERRGYQTKAFERARLDIANQESVADAIAGFAPSAVFNAAAYNLVDIAEREPQAAFEINALGVRNLALACRQNNARLVHFSTDYVFDGSLGRPCTEQDPVHPLGAYGVSKLAGELYAQAYLEDPLVIRTCGVFGVGARQTARGNFPETMLRLAQSGKPIRVIADTMVSPTFAPALASRSIDLLEAGASGIFHIGGGQPISWFDYARLIFAKAGIDVPVQPTSSAEYRTDARRPKFSALQNARLEQSGIGTMPELSDAVATYIATRV